VGHNGKRRIAEGASAVDVGPVKNRGLCLIEDARDLMLTPAPTSSHGEPMRVNGTELRNQV
jgi:hypothetical protein